MAEKETEEQARHPQKKKKRGPYGGATEDQKRREKLCRDRSPKEEAQSRISLSNNKEGLPEVHAEHGKKKNKRAYRSSAEEKEGRGAWSCVSEKRTYRLLVFAGN